MTRKSEQGERVSAAGSSGDGTEARPEARSFAAAVEPTSADALRRALESISACVQIVDENWRLVYINECCRQFLRDSGLDTERILGQHYWEDLFPTLRGSRVHLEYQRAMQERVPIEIEHRAEHTGRCYTIRVAPIQQSGLAISFVDITAHKQMEATLRARARELESIMEMVPAVIFVADDAQCRSIRTNRTGRELLGLPSGANVSKSAPPDQAPTSFKVLARGVELSPSELPVQRAARGDAVANFEEDIVFADGRVRHWIGNAAPLLNEEGRPAGAVAAFIDITERKRAEVALAASARQKDALYRLTDRLQRTDSVEEIYDAALQAIMSAVQCDRASILLTDTSGTMRFVGWVRLSTEYRQVAQGHSPWPMHAKTPAPIYIEDVREADIQEPLKSNILDEGLLALAFIPLVASGRLIGKFMTYFDRPHRFTADEIDLCVTIARQLAVGIERKRAEAALRDADRRKDEFLAMLAHELRNPLSSITNAVALMQRASADADIQEQARAIVERQASRLARLVDDLLEVSRITSGRIQLQAQRVSLDDILDRAIETVRPMIDKHRHTLSVTSSRQSIWIEADAARLEQVFVNLLSNAAKYTDEGGRIDVELTRDANEAIVRVRDTGIGMEPDLLPHVFDLFAQGRRTLDRSQGGLGIGLSLVQRLLAMHGGSVGVESTLGHGSTFTVRLPLLHPTDFDASGEQSVATIPAPRARKILVIDDNADAAHSLSLLLQTSGHSVLVAFDGEQALRAAEAQPLDAIFVDIGLPGMDGYEVAQRLRKLDGARGALLVALTGYGQPSDRERSREAGFDRHLIKPADFAAIERMLAER